MSDRRPPRENPQRHIPGDNPPARVWQIPPQYDRSGREAPQEPPVQFRPGPEEPNFEGLRRQIEQERNNNITRTPEGTPEGPGLLPRGLTPSGPARRT
jgi:hypothetical protein